MQDKTKLAKITYSFTKRCYQLSVLCPMEPYYKNSPTVRHLLYMGIEAIHCSHSENAYADKTHTTYDISLGNRILILVACFVGNTE